MFPRMMTSRIAWAPDDGGAGGAGAGDAGGAAAAAALSTEQFLALIPEEIRGEAYFKDIKDPGALATKAFHQAKLIGVPPDQLIRMPAPDDTEAWNGVWGKLGRPESPDKYVLADPNDLPDGLVLNPAAKTAFAKTAHELGLSQKQADALYQTLNGERIAGFSKTIEGWKTGIAARDQAIADEWGPAAPQRREDLNRAVAHIAGGQKLGDALQKAIDATPGEEGVAVIKAFAEIGRQMREDGVFGRDGQGAPGLLAPAEAKQQINALMGSPSSDPVLMAAYRDKSAPGHADAVAKVGQLYAQAYPPQQAAA